jgi:response regulator RpfG family c-di-GMP phosphodiesterase
MLSLNMEGIMEHQSKVLIVDDENYFLKACIRYFTDKCYLLTTNSGMDALEIIKEHPDIDFIILDVNIPDLSGKRIFEYIARTFPQMLNRIIFITGCVLDEDTQKFLDSISNPTLMKPFELEVLMEKIGRKSVYPKILE